MIFESIKSILFGLTAIILLIEIIRNKNAGKAVLRFLISSFLITIVFLLAITFKIHHILRSAFNIPNTVTYLAVSVFFLYYLIKFRNEIINSGYIILIISAVMLILGGLVDLISDAEIITMSGLDVIEELFSAGGALFWLLFFYRSRFKARIKSS